jgi:hypothetical protein
MNSREVFFRLAIVLVSFGCAAGAIPPAEGQQSGEAPKPPAKVYGPLGVEDQQDQSQTPDMLQPDDRPLTGFQPLTVGTPIERHSYWVPGVSYYNFIQSTGVAQGGGTDWNSTSYLAGNVSLLESWSRSRLALNYSGGGNFSTDPTIGNGWFQQLNAEQTFNWQRWQLMLVDYFSYLPQSQFGFGAGTGLALPGVGGTFGGGIAGLSPGYGPGQTIFSATGRRYMNSAGVQVTYLLTRRSSITVGGLYGLVRFQEPGNVDSDNYIGIIGYNYQLTKTDTLGLSYRYSSFHYPGTPQALGDQLIQVAYAKRITGRLALQLSAGPEITNYRVPQPPSTKTQFIAGAGTATLTYALGRGGVSVAYFHGVTAGSGIYLGATTDQVTASANRKLTRMWSGEFHVGYADNRSQGASQGVSNLSSVDYNTVFVGGTASRPLGRNASFTVGYTAYIESTNNSGCTGSGCNANYTNNQINVGVNWHTRPFVLR